MKTHHVFVAVVFHLLVLSSSLDHVVRQGERIEILFNDINRYYHHVQIFYRKFEKSEKTVIWSNGIQNNSYKERYTGVALNHNEFRLVILNVQYEDAGTFFSSNSPNIEHNLIVIGRYVEFKTEDGQSHIFAASKDTYRVKCLFNMSSHPWEKDEPILKVEGAIKAMEEIRENFIVTSSILLSTDRTKSFTCKVSFPPNDALTESSPFWLILEDDESFLATLGEQVNLPCFSLNPSNRRWRWFHQRLFHGHKLNFPFVDCIMINDTECRNISTKPLVSDDFSSRSFTSLKFSKIGFESAGTYVCIDDMFITHKSYNLAVVDRSPQSISVKGEPVEQNASFGIIRGSTTFISCSILSVSHENRDGGHHPRLIVDDAEFVNKTREGDLLVYNYRTTVNESRSFRCSIEVKQDFQVLHGFENYTVFVEVFNCPEQVEIVADMSNGSVERGAVLSCRTSANPPVNVTWTSGNNSLDVQVGPNYADVRVYDKLNYTCRTNSTHHKVIGTCAVLESSIEPEDVTTRRYKEILKVIQVGDSSTIECSTSHQKNDNWKWFRDWIPNSGGVQEPLVDCLLSEDKECLNVSTSDRFHDLSTSSETQVILWSARIEDSATYSCMDSLRTVEKTFRVEVLACPTNLVSSRKLLRGVTELTCNVTSNPAVNVTWISVGDSSILSSGLNAAKMMIDRNGSFKCSVQQIDHPILGKCSDLFHLETVDNFSK